MTITINPVKRVKSIRIKIILFLSKCNTYNYFTCIQIKYILQNNHFIDIWRERQLKLNKKLFHREVDPWFSWMFECRKTALPSLGNVFVEVLVPMCYAMNFMSKHICPDLFRYSSSFFLRCSRTFTDVSLWSYVTVPSGHCYTAPPDVVTIVVVRENSGNLYTNTLVFPAIY